MPFIGGQTLKFHTPETTTNVQTKFCSTGLINFIVRAHSCNQEKTSTMSCHKINLTLFTSSHISNVYVHTHTAVVLPSQRTQYSWDWPPFSALISVHTCGLARRCAHCCAGRHRQSPCLRYMAATRVQRRTSFGEIHARNSTRRLLSHPLRGPTWFPPLSDVYSFFVL